MLLASGDPEFIKCVKYLIKQAIRFNPLNVFLLTNVKLPNTFRRTVKFLIFCWNRLDVHLLNLMKIYDYEENKREEYNIS